MSKIHTGNWNEMPWMPVRKGMQQVVIGYGAEQLTCGIGLCENDHSLRPHAHPEEQIAVCLRGKMDYYVDGVPYKMTAGSWVVVPPNVEHYAKTYESDEPVLAMDIFPSRPSFGEPYREFCKKEGIDVDE